MILETAAEQAAFRDLVEEAWGEYADCRPLPRHAPSPTPWPVAMVIFPDFATLADVRFSA